MLSLLLLSAVLSAPSAVAQAAVAPGHPLAVEAPQTDIIRPEMPLFVEERQARQFDVMEIHPDTDICFKIRAYIFSTGPVPKFLRETTCGPRPATTKRIDGFKPGLMPVDAGEQPVGASER